MLVYMVVKSFCHEELAEDNPICRSIRTNCPAHIMLRASKDGTKLEVTSVNNEHNHEISEELFKNLPQERKLCGEIKQEVQDLMQLHIDRKRLKEYVRLRTNKVLRSKDLFNIAAANKQKREITPKRAYQLFKKIHDIEKLQGRDHNIKIYSESEDEIAQTIKRMKTEQESPWGQDGLSVELEGSEGNDGEETYGAQLAQEDTVDEIDASEDPLLRTDNDGDIISANGEIVGELVMEDGDPSVIVESIVNADGSVFVDEREFNPYCNNHLAHTVHGSQSPTSQVIDIQSITPSTEVRKITRKISTSPSSVHQSRSLSPGSQLTSKSPNTFHDSSDSRIWIMKEATKAEAEQDSCLESETNSLKNSRLSKTETDAVEVVLSEETSHRLLQEQLAVLKAEQGKLYHETEMLKLKKDKLKLQMSCYTNEIRKQEMEKEKLRLEIKLLKSKVMEDTNDVSHYIFVP
ncbi:uncharacterized protein LOC105703558 isoform X2 [Orussus abietinus]|uniref:uncharacterized protein LOC105703558 isoform X2 n=1 Tax=Orussus abietinus TaxID=222816 RepID=UPI00062545D9|nr:uncharacterized protein LOC105703558 isoform X2 [Orussus abietinus]